MHVLLILTPLRRIPAVSRSAGVRDLGQNLEQPATLAFLATVTSLDCRRTRAKRCNYSIQTESGDPMMVLGQRMQQLLPAKLRRGDPEDVGMPKTSYDVMRDDVAPSSSDEPVDQSPETAAEGTGDLTHMQNPVSSKRLKFGDLKSSIPFLSRQQPRSAPATDEETAVSATNIGRPQSGQRTQLGCFGDMWKSNKHPEAARRREILNRLSDGAKTRLGTAQQLAADSIKPKKVKIDRYALQCAAWKGDAAKVKELLEQGAKTSALDKAGVAPLHYAAWHGHLDVMRQLLAAGAGVGQKDVDGLTPLHYAAWGNQLEAATVLLAANAPVDALSTGRLARYTPLYYAAKMGNVLLAQLLLQRGARWDGGDKVGAASPLHEAAWCGHADVVAELLRHGAQHDAPTQGHLYRPLHLAAMAKQDAVVQVLVYYGANTNARTKDARTPLHLAASKGYLSTCQQLLNAQADPNVRDKRGMTPLHLAVQAGPAHMQVVDLLLAHGARYTGSTAYKEAVHYASDAHLRKLLLGLQHYGAAPLHAGVAAKLDARAGRFALATSSNLAAHNQATAPEAAADATSMQGPVTASGVEVARAAAIGSLVRNSSGASSTDSARRRRLAGAGAFDPTAAGPSASRMRTRSMSAVEGDALSRGAANSTTAAVVPLIPPPAAPAAPPRVAAAAAAPAVVVVAAAGAAPSAQQAAEGPAPSQVAGGSSKASSCTSPTSWFVPEEAAAAGGAVAASSLPGPQPQAAAATTAASSAPGAGGTAAAVHPSSRAATSATSSAAGLVQCSRRASLQGSSSSATAAAGAATESVAPEDSLLGETDSRWSTISLSEGPGAPHNSLAGGSGSLLGGEGSDLLRVAQSPSPAAATPEDVLLLDQIRRMLAESGTGTATGAAAAVGAGKGAAGGAGGCVGQDSWELDAFLRQPASIGLDASQQVRVSPDIPELLDCQRLLLDQRGNGTGQAAAALSEAATAVAAAEIATKLGSGTQRDAAARDV